MKRTRQVFHYGQDAVPTDISGCRHFHGEDLRKYHSAYNTSTIQLTQLQLKESQTVDDVYSTLLIAAVVI